MLTLSLNLWEVEGRIYSFYVFTKKTIVFNSWVKQVVGPFTDNILGFYPGDLLYLIVPLIYPWVSAKFKAVKFSDIFDNSSSSYTLSSREIRFWLVLFPRITGASDHQKCATSSIMRLFRRPYIAASLKWCWLCQFVKRLSIDHYFDVEKIPTKDSQDASCPLFVTLCPFHCSCNDPLHRSNFFRNWIKCSTFLCMWAPVEVQWNRICWEIIEIDKALNSISEIYCALEHHRNLEGFDCTIAMYQIRPLFESDSSQLCILFLLGGGFVAHAWQ